ncbi:hypothetical protein HK101_011581 [Irineochytrium annulatum]|nr:hypothetical protein HK101_011581 [Irineochytrium annulatum]
MASAILKSLLVDPSEVYYMLTYMLTVSDNATRYKELSAVPKGDLATRSHAMCYYFLNKTSRSFARVIQELDPELTMPVCVFYLVLRGLDTVEDDMSLDLGRKLEVLRSFYKVLRKEGWTFNENGPREKDRILMVDFDVVIDQFLKLDKRYQAVIEDIAHRMGDGMAEFCEGKEVLTMADYNLYTHYVAGLVGIGLTGLFVASGLESPQLSIASEKDNARLPDHMGRFLQKVNIIKDYLEDLNDGRKFWPKEVWGKYMPEGTEKESLEVFRDPKNIEYGIGCLNELCADALELVPDCLTYMSLLRNPTVVHFCAIPQVTIKNLPDVFATLHLTESMKKVMAIASIALFFNNPAIFSKTGTKIRRGLAVKLIYRGTTFEGVKRVFEEYALQIARTNAVTEGSPMRKQDGTYMRVSQACMEIIRWIKIHDQEHSKKKPVPSLVRTVARDMLVTMVLVSVAGLLAMSYLPVVVWTSSAGGNKARHRGSFINCAAVFKPGLTIPFSTRRRSPMATANDDTPSVNVLKPETDPLTVETGPSLKLKRTMEPLRDHDAEDSDWRQTSPNGPPTMSPKTVRRTSLAGAPGMLRTDGPWWTDQTGRTLMLRGVNVSGSAKQPFTPNVQSHVKENFFEDKKISFVGRPFPLNEADEHFARLRRWGFNFCRFNVAWEALEHEGPGIYDYDYMDYVVEILKRAKHFGFRVFIDPHQDVWSRYSGGSGAPGWTFRVAGLDVTKFKDTYAALVHNTYDDPKNFPKMIWATNYYKLACATMFTLFFGGETFAPNCKAPDGTNIQAYLQSHYANAFAELAKRIQNSMAILEDEVVIGYDTLNEPSQGFIGYADLSVISPLQDLRHGYTPTPFQGMLLGMGNSCPNVEDWILTWAGPMKNGATTLSPPPLTTCWLDGECLWAKEGVWDTKTRTLLRKNYFAVHPETGKPVDFLKEFWRPFVHYFTSVIRRVHRTGVIFVEPPVNEHPPVWDAANGDPVWRIAYAPHWYDGLTLINKKFNRWFTVDVIGMKRGHYPGAAFAVKFGALGIRKCFRSQIEMLRREGLEYLGQNPCIMGEIGIPYDMDERRAYITGDYTNQEHALDMNMKALEENLINFTLWNYCSDNNNQWGDGWNGEDLSIFSRLPNPGTASRSAVVRSSRQSSAPVEVALQPIKGKVSPDDPESTSSSASSFHSVIEPTHRAERDQSPTRSTAPLISGADALAAAYHDTLPVPKDARTRAVSDASSVASDNARAHFEPHLVEAEDWLDVGGRALKAFARPYPVLTPGTPLHLSFDMNTSLFTFTFCHPSDPEAALGGTTARATKRRKGFRHQYRRLYLMPQVIRRRLSSTFSSEDMTLALGSGGGERGAGPGSQGSLANMGSSGYSRVSMQHGSLASHKVASEVEIYLPKCHFPQAEEVEVWVSDGTFRVEPADQRLHWRCGCFDQDGVWRGPVGVTHGDVEHTIVVRRRKAGGEEMTIVGRRRRREVAEELDGAEGGSSGGRSCPSCSIM